LHVAARGSTATPAVRPTDERPPGMLRPDQYYMILAIMRFGSLTLAIVFASKIVAYAAHHPI
jgi:hypothetical protein